MILPRFYWAFSNFFQRILRAIKQRLRLSLRYFRAASRTRRKDKAVRVLGQEAFDTDGETLRLIPLKPPSASRPGWASPVCAIASFEMDGGCANV